MERIFMDWNRPALQVAADYLLQLAQQTETGLDLSHCLVVSPSSRANRRLLELLALRTSHAGQTIQPPVLKTVGSLPEALYSPKRPFANELTQRLAWARALRETGGEDLQRVVPHPPHRKELPRWVELGDLFRRQHRELAANALDFADVAHHYRERGEADEAMRWDAMRKVQEAYLHSLDQVELWDVQTARLVAIRQRECRSDRRIILVATVDMNVALRQMLDQVSPQVTALVFAPPERAERFDEHGCLLAEHWAEAPIDLPTEVVVVADDVADQARAVVDCIAGYQARYRADQITLGVPESRTVPHLQRQLDQYGLPSRWGPGTPVADTGPYLLLHAIADCLDRGQIEEQAALLRHPHVQQWLESEGISTVSVKELDDYYNQHLQTRLDGPWLSKGTRHNRIRRALQTLARLLQPLLEVPERPLSEWAEPIMELLVELYGHVPAEAEETAQRAIVPACQSIQQALQQQQAIPATLALRVAASQAIRWALQEVSRVTIPAPAETPAIELLGWLELPLDDAPALIVTSFNEGLVPTSINADMFLPNSLRRSLGLEDNLQRYARDAYALQLLIASRDHLQLIVGKRNLDHDPLVPSRLLFAADGETVLARVKRFFRARESTTPRYQPPPGVQLPAQHRFAVPEPEPLKEPVAKLNVTDFREYLKCPYRFYLKRVLKLETVADTAQEMDGGVFGTLIHNVLDQFGSGAVAESTDAAEIRGFLARELDRQFAQLFGSSPRAALRVQVEQMRERLAAFARWQADWARQGWKIVYTEESLVASQCDLIVDDEPMRIRGRIDRIDRHRDTGQWMIFDYKSSDRGATPEEAHRRGGEWIDLQLPLYRHLAASSGVTGDVGLAYILLPRDIKQTGAAEAPWSDAELQEADEVAAGVVRDVRDEYFWEPADPPPLFSEDFAPICQDFVLDKWKPQGAR